MEGVSYGTGFSQDKKGSFICYVKRRLAGTLDYVTPTMDV